MTTRIKLVVFDWAGTAVDFGCFAPVAPFVEVFRRRGIELTHAQARGPMGLYKRDHLRALAQLPEVVQLWQQQFGRPCVEDDIDQMFHEDFVPLQLAAAGDHARLVPGLLECQEKLKQREILIGTGTGYFREAAEIVYAAARQQGYEPDFNVCADDVRQARPEPWMIYRNMEQLGIYPPAAVVKVGDTLADIQEGRNAGVWSVGVTNSSSLMGLDEQEFQRLEADDRAARVAEVEQQLKTAGAHFVIGSVAELPELIEQIQRDSPASCG